MKTERNILIAFFLNLFFSLIEIFGGIYTGSIAILSDSVHDLGDSVSLGIAFLLEKKSKKNPDEIYTYGYARFSVLGAVITNTILIFSSLIVIYSAIKKIIEPNNVRSGYMIFFAAFGVIVNLFAFFFTRKADNLNQRAVNLHMLEDVLCWLAILTGTIVMKYTNIIYLDPIMSICMAVFVCINAIKGFKKILDLFLEKMPKGIFVDEIKSEIMEITGVVDLYHIHIRSVDGVVNCATMHVVTNGENEKIIKKEIRKILCEKGISHVTLELENIYEL